MNYLYYRDNLDVLRRHIKDETVDLVYLDPPFKSNQDYNVLFAEKDGTGAASQFKAFEDTWEWNIESLRVFEELIESGGAVSDVMQAFRRFLGTNDMLAYLTMMAPRLGELRRALKTTGSIYLHCDNTASHYLKLLMDAIFGPKTFRNEITWKRRVGMSSAVHESNRFGVCTDILLFYAKTADALFHPQYNRDTPEYQEYIRTRFTSVDENGRLFQPTSLVNPAHRPNLIYDYKGYKSPPNGWMIRREKMELWDLEGKLYFPKDKEGRIRRKSYADELKGMPIQNLWTDISELNSQAQERLGYPTQKPEALLERIVRASSNESDCVLDPFCGCGTAVAVAQRLNRNSIGIDITHLAIGLIKSRLRDAFGDEIAKTYSVVGEPVSEQDASELAKEDPYQFQWWALGLVGARRSEQKKGSDQGIDGRLYFHDESEGGKTKQIILSVKAGHVNVSIVRDLRGVIEREKAEIGVLLAMEEPTRPMMTEAASAGLYKSPWGSHPRLQVLTIAELLSGKGIDYPHVSNVTFKRAPLARGPEVEQLTLAPALETSSKRKRK